MFRSILKFFIFVLAASFSNFALAMIPLHRIALNDPSYSFYSAVANVDQKLVNDGWIGGKYAEFNQWNVQGRIVPVRDGSSSNPINLVVSVNGGIYYVDGILRNVKEYKIRRRWRNNPEPGIFLRIEGERLNPEDGIMEQVTLWLKIATPEGRSLPVLDLLEGDFDLAGIVPKPNEPTKPKAIPAADESPILPPTSLTDL